MKRTLEEVLKSLNEAEKEFNEKLDKYGLNVKPKKKEDPNKEVNEETIKEQEIIQDNTDDTQVENGN